MFAKDYMQKGKVPVIFVILVGNYSNHKGFELNDSKYTDFSYEKEHLLPLDYRVFVADAYATDHDIKKIKD